MHGAVLVPLRGIFEQLGASVDYNASTKTIQAQSGSTSINLPIGSSTAYVNGQPKSLDQPATVIAGTTLVPLRFVAEALGANVQWVGTTHTVYILAPNTMGPPTAAIPTGPPPGAGATAVAIDSFTTDASRALKIGDTINATLQGTPGATASFSIPNIVDNVPMHETSPGVYSGSYTVTSRVYVTGGAILGRLVGRGGGSAPIIQAAQTVTIDATPPTIGNETPTGEAKVSTARPRIYATLNDGPGTGVNPQSVQITLDGQDVTANAIVTPQFVTYQPQGALGEGSHTVAISAQDMVGNTARREWRFAIAAQQGLVSSFTSNLQGSNAQLAGGQSLALTLHAQPGGSATFSVGADAKNIAMKETSPGLYEGMYMPGSGSSAQNAPVVAHFTAANGTTATTTLDQTITIAAAGPQKPTITSPKDGASVPGSIVVEGDATPNTLVDVSISFKSRAFGVLPVSGGGPSTQVTSDSRGHWKTAALSLGTPSLLGTGRNTQYTITALTEDATGQQSESDSVTVSPQ
jgi:hypothetical protein